MSGCTRGFIGSTPESREPPPTNPSAAEFKPLKASAAKPPPPAKTDFIIRSGQSISDCMRPCAVQFDAQAGRDLSWDGGDGYGGTRGVAESEFVWDYGDGGNTADADGYLAAKVYESSGAYSVKVTVNDKAWGTQTVTVVDPEWVGCVSPSSKFEGCPTSNRFTEVSAALSAAGAKKRHVLLHRGESHGSLPSKTDDVQTMIGAYGKGAKPRVSGYYFRLSSTWRLVDLELTSIINSNGDEDTVVAPTGPGGLMLRIDGRGNPEPMWMEMRRPVFIIDSNIKTGSSYVLMNFDDTQWGVVQGSTFYSSGNLHVARVDGDNQRKWLFKNSSFDHGEDGVSGLRISGTSEWIVVQGCRLGDILSMQDSGPEDMSIQRYIIAERNILDRSQYQGPWASVGSQFTGMNHVVRNNVAIHGGGSDGIDFSAGTLPATEPKNIWFINNTSINNNSSGFMLTKCPTCIAVNNIIYTTVEELDGSGCPSGPKGITLANNWCYSTRGTCRDPSDGDRDCHDPKFESLKIGDAGFARPAARSAGINKGKAAPVWRDLNGSARDKQIDIGAVER